METTALEEPLLVEEPKEEKPKPTQLVNKDPLLRTLGKRAVRQLISAFFRDGQGRVFYLERVQPNQNNPTGRSIHVVRTDGKISERMKHDYFPSEDEVVDMLDSFDLGIRRTQWIR